MERVVKRYLMYNQGDVDDVKQNEFDGIKQDLQLMRVEIRNDMKKSRDDTIRNMFIINNGIQFIAEELMEQCSKRRTNLVGSIGSYKPFKVCNMFIIVVTMSHIKTHLVA